MEIGFQPGDRGVEELFVFAKNRAVAREQPLDVAGADSLQAADEGRDVAAVMGVDRPHAAVAINVVAAQEQIAEAERELAIGMSRRVPDFEALIANGDDVSFID